ncbi:MAG: hypothetical protein MJ064_01285 [Lachnospiraceae bacterium]|nr:hypothetical protein [Lachnospiraceae bacterium]
MTIEEAYSFVKNEKTTVSKPGLTRIHTLLRLLGNPEQHMKLIHVVGTNGKGSVSAMLSSVLKAAGYRVGLMSSPYLYSLKDYYRLGGELPSDEAYIRAVETVSEACRLMNDDYPSEFELAVAVGIILFLQTECEYVVLEAGMGGGKDATNLETPGIMTVVTHIAMDHEGFLGRDQLAIAKEKLAIAAKGESIVLAANEKDIRRFCAFRAFENNSPFVYAKDPEVDLSVDKLGAKLSLKGSYQRENAATVCAAVYTLRKLSVYISDAAVKEGLENTFVPFRFQIRKTKPYLIMDGGHNPDCIDALTESLSELPGKPMFTVVTGVMADKDYCAMYPKLLPYVRRFLTVTPNNPRALPAKDLRNYLRSIGAEAEAKRSISSAADAVRLAYEAGEDVLCTGTLYMMAELEACFLENGLLSFDRTSDDDLRRDIRKTDR